MATVLGVQYQAGAQPMKTLKAACTDPATPAIGNPVRLGSITGIALTPEDTDGNTTVDLGTSIWGLSVKGIDGSGNSAVAVGDALYYVDADTPKVSKKTAGYFIGYALEVVLTSATTTIKVLVGPKRG